MLTHFELRYSIIYKRLNICEVVAHYLVSSENALRHTENNYINATKKIVPQTAKMSKNSLKHYQLYFIYVLRIPMLNEIFKRTKITENR